MALIPDKDVGEQMHQSICDEYAPKFYIDCHNISSDFHEDLSFRFSLGPMAVLGKLIGPMAPGGGARKAALAVSSDPSNLFSLLAVKQLLPNITGRSVLATVLLGGLVLKATGWKVLGACGSIYGLMYAYEYSTWTTRAKEKAFKAQFRSYVSEKLELVMAMTSKHSAEQVRLSVCFAMGSGAG